MLVQGCVKGGMLLVAIEESACGGEDDRTEIHPSKTRLKTRFKRVGRSQADAKLKG